MWLSVTKRTSIGQFYFITQSYLCEVSQVCEQQLGLRLVQEVIQAVAKSKVLLCSSPWCRSALLLFKAPGTARSIVFRWQLIIDCQTGVVGVLPLPHPYLCPALPAWRWIFHCHSPLNCQTRSVWRSLHQGFSRRVWVVVDGLNFDGSPWLFMWPRYDGGWDKNYSGQPPCLCSGRRRSIQLSVLFTMLSRSEYCRWCWGMAPILCL